MAFSIFSRRIIQFAKQHGLLAVALTLVISLPLLWIFPLRGVIGVYYDNRDWRGEPVITARQRMINLETVARRQGAFPQTNFSVSWGGWIRIDRAGEYAFSTISDDGSALWINSELVVDNGGFHPARRASGSIMLSQGLHLFRVSFVQGAGAYQLQVFWTPPGEIETWIPPDVLYPHPFPIRGIGFLTRHLKVFYALAWLLLLGALGQRFLRKQTDHRQLFKTYMQNLSLSLATILLMFFLAEGAIRLISSFRENRKDLAILLQESKETELQEGARTYGLKGIVQDSPYQDIVYELKPNLQGYFLDAPLLTNSRGLRDYEYSYQKPENTFRIVGLGDSSLFGWGVLLEETSLKVLERTLNEQSSDMKFEVINFAAPGYNTAIEVEVFRQKCLRYDPDLVIMHFNTNDYDVPGFMKAPQNYSTLRKSYLLDFIYTSYQTLRGIQKQEMIPFVFDRTMGMEQSDRLDLDPNFPDEYRHMVGVSGFLQAMDILVQETKAREIPLLVYVIKGYPGLDPEYTPNAFRDGQLQLITELSEEKGFFLLNMYPYYMEYLQQHPAKDQKVFWVTSKDSHPSALAHKLEAEAFFEFLVNQKLIPLSNEHVARNEHFAH